MTDKYKEALRAALEAKKQRQSRGVDGNKREIYKGTGSRRKGIKQRKQGGLFDK